MKYTKIQIWGILKIQNGRLIFGIRSFLLKWLFLVLTKDVFYTPINFFHSKIQIAKNHAKQFGHFEKGRWLYLA